VDYCDLKKEQAYKAKDGERMKFISIEGSSFVGKTTIVNDLGRMGFQTIPEYDAFGPFIQSDGTVETNKRIAQDFVYREQKRTEMLTKLSNQIVFADRSPLSLITFEDMQALEHPGEKKYRYETRKYIIELLHDNIVNGSIVLPNSLIIPRIDSQSSFLERVTKRGITPVQELSKFAVQQFITEKTIQYGCRILGNESVESVDVSNQSSSNVTDLIIAAAQEAKPSLQNKPITDLL